MLLVVPKYLKVRSVKRRLCYLAVSMPLSRSTVYFNLEMFPLPEPAKRVGDRLEREMHVMGAKLTLS